MEPVCWNDCTAEAFGCMNCVGCYFLFIFQEITVVWMEQRFTIWTHSSTNSAARGRWCRLPIVNYYNDDRNKWLKCWWSRLGKHSSYFTPHWLHLNPGCKAADSPVGGAASSLGCRGATGSLLAVHPGVWKTNRQIRLDTDAWCLTAWPEGDGDEGGQVTQCDPAAGSQTHNTTHTVVNKQLPYTSHKTNRRLHSYTLSPHTQTCWPQPATLTSGLRV